MYSNAVKRSSTGANECKVEFRPHKFVKALQSVVMFDSALTLVASRYRCSIEYSANTDYQSNPKGFAELTIN